MKIRKEIDYWGTGFKVVLLKFPFYEDEGEFFPDVPLGKLHKFIALKIIEKPNLLTGREFSFLRATAELNRSESARKLGITRRTLINWEEENDKPIKAIYISHLGIRLFFHSWIFPAVKDISSDTFMSFSTEVNGLTGLSFYDFQMFDSKREYRLIQSSTLVSQSVEERT